VVTSFVFKLLQSLGNPFFQEQLLEVGFLVHWESLLSTIGDEAGMLEDFITAIHDANNIVFKVSESTYLEVCCSVGHSVSGVCFWKLVDTCKDKPRPQALLFWRTWCVKPHGGKLAVDRALSCRYRNFALQIEGRARNEATKAPLQSSSQDLVVQPYLLTSTMVTMTTSIRNTVSCC
jgi:hypothetical protein